MNAFILQMLNHKINTIKKDELIQLANQNNINLTENQAKKIVAILRSEMIDIQNLAQRKRLLAKIKQQLNSKTERQMSELLKQYDHYL